jgi:PAS domain S-box-containing protein
MPSDTKPTEELINPTLKATLVGLFVFFAVIAATIYIAFQQYKVRQTKNQDELQRELSHVKDRFRNILYADITTANALAIIYKEYGKPKNFDRIATELIENNKYVEAIQLTVNGVITNVYPLKGYENTIGINTEQDTIRKTESTRAKEKNEIFFAGPRPLRMGGIGILAKVPIILDHNLEALCVVLTRMETVKAGLDLDKEVNERFSYELLKKTPDNGYSSYFLTRTRPASKSQTAAIEIPEGDWTLRISFSSDYTANQIPFAVSVMGFLFASLAGYYAFKGIRRPYALREIIASQTSELAAKEKYFRTLIETSTDAIVLLDETGKVLYQTPSTERISGYSFAEIQDIDSRKLVHPQHREISSTIFRDILNIPGKKTSTKFKLKHKNGHYIWVEGTYRNLLLEESVKAIVFNYNEITDRVVAESKLLETRNRLKERVKELSTVFNVSTILQNNKQKTSSLFSEIAEILPAGWQFSEICEAKIEFNNKIYTSEGYAPSPYRQVAEFRILDGHSGTIEVIYTESSKPEFEGPFLKEERNLLNTLAEMIQVYLNKKAHQESLARSEARFRGAFEFSAIGMALASLEGNFMMVNRAFCEMLGYTEQELLSLTFVEVTEPDDLESNLSLIQETLEGKRDYFRQEKRYIHKNGSIVWVNLNAALIRDNNGEPLYFVGQIENITARRESEMKFRNLVERSAVGVYILQNDKFVYVNPWIAEETGYPEKELLKFSMKQLVHPEYLEMVNKVIDFRAKGEMGTRRYELKALKKNGEIIWLEIFGNGTYFEGKPAVIGTMVDISKRKAAFEKLTKSEANLKSVFDNTQVSFLLLDTNYNVLAINQHFFENYQELTGFKLQIGTYFLGSTLPERRKIIEQNFKTILTSGKSINYETVYNGTGNPKYVDITISPVIANGNIVGFCVASIDISVRKNMELERQKMLSELISRNKKMEEFAAIVSHNLRAPLSNILGLADLITEGIARTSEEYILNGIKTSADKMNDVVKEMNQILYYQNDFSEQNTTVDLSALMEEVKEDFKAQIANSQAQIEYDFTAAPKLVTIRSFIHNIFTNLLSNSLNFRKPDEQLHIKIWAEKEPGNVVVHFQDNGIGIDLNQYGDQIFGLNKRFHPAISGKGLGLFMVKAQVDSLNGTITVKSNLDQGTVFTITLTVS